MTDLRPGDPAEIAGYRVLRRLGVGGQGVVYLATTPAGEPVAIKQLLPGPQDARARQQFVKEVAAVRRVAPFCTARVLAAELDGPSPYLVSEYIDGPSLAQQIQRNGPLSGVTLHRLAIGTITALAAIHQAGVVHRDFKPANVMLAADGPRVIDFGIARDLSAEMTMTTSIAGTPTYMAPEQLRADRVGPAADLFAWASVMAYAATGRAPFEAPHMMASVYRITSGEPDLNGVPAELLPVLRYCLDKDPARRPTAQQTLALLLGRPAPEHDARDATQVLTEAVGIVHADSAPTTVRPPAGWVAPAAGSGTATGWSGAAIEPAARRGRTAVLVVAVLVLVLVAAWVFAHSGLVGASNDGTAPGSSPGQTTGSHGAAQPGTGKPKSRPTDPVTVPAKVPVTSPAPVTTAPTADPQTPTPAPSTVGGGQTVAPGTVPARFAGIWKGVGNQPNGRPTTWTMRLTLTEGSITGRMQLLDLGCSGSLTVATAANRLLVLDAVTDHDPHGLCAPHGTLWLTSVGPDRLTFVWQDVDHPTNQATGQLRRL